MLTNEPLLLVSLGIGGVISIIIYIAASRILRRGNKNYSFIDLARDSDGYPSLARFQFLSWTMVIIFSFTTIAIIRILGGVLEFPGEIPRNLLTLMGISVSVTPVSAYL